MSAQILDAIDGIITVEITGKLSPADLAQNQAEVLKYLRQWGGGAILSICEEFEGFTDGDWSDISFQMEADPLIRKMALIGKEQGEETTLMFVGKGRRPFPVEFFPPGHLIEARAWLQS